MPTNLEAWKSELGDLTSENSRRKNPISPYQIGIEFVCAKALRRNNCGFDVRALWGLLSVISDNCCDKSFRVAQRALED